MSVPRVVDFVDEFAEALKEQLLEDEKRWGDTWLHRPARGQEKRTFDRLCDYEEIYLCGGSVPWLRVASEALVCWIRDNYPELSKEWQDGKRNS